MKVTLQIHTGGFGHATTDTKAIIDRLIAIANYFPIHSLIYGWNRTEIDHHRIYNFCKQRQIDVYAWLPVFSELEGQLQLEPFLGSDGTKLNPYSLSDTENFTFCCPQHPQNKQMITDYLLQAFPYAYFDGVFFDRMRYPSAIHGQTTALGCYCSFCQQTDNLTFRTSPTYKSSIIQSSMLSIVEEFKKKGLKIGFDLFAMPFNLSVGQDYDFLVPLCDFFKPMYYTHTYAPAGMPFEAKALAYSLDQWQYYTSQDHYTELAQKYGNKLRLGLEWNIIEPIVNISPQILVDHLKKAQRAGIEHVVLSWQAMSAPQANILAVADFENKRL